MGNIGPMMGQMTGQPMTRSGIQQPVVQQSSPRPQTTGIETMLQSLMGQMPGLKLGGQNRQSGSSRDMLIQSLMRR